MESDRELNEFAIQLQQDIISIADTESSESLRADVFTQYMIDELIEAGELEDGTTCYHNARGVEVSGYNLDNDGTLDLFTTIYTQLVPPQTVGKGDVEAGFKRLNRFLQRALDRYYTALEEASPAFDMAEHIFECRRDIIRVRLYLFTDGLTTVDTIPDVKLNELQISYHVWDIRRLYRYISSGKHKEPIHIDFVEQFGTPLPCLQGSDAAADYSAYLTIIPGDILNSLYATYGARLLELNVRSYLQAKGKVNQGIRRTILEQPERFLAYNNGISATASNIELVHLSGGGFGIKSLSDLQIVNGGQTTASIFHAARKDKAEVSRLGIQAKISVVAPDDIANLVPLISRYANSQNKVSEADFSANEPFHVKLEALSRSIWAPATDGTQRQTRWFYERARGQYQDAIAREGTPGRQRQFKEIHPTTQRFTKTDLAKFEMTWEQLPHIVSQGAQKCFTQFTLRLQKRGNFEVDQAYFHRLVAKAILFRQAEKIVAMQKFGGYRANVVTYTLAYIFHRTAGRIDLDRIWQQQNIGQGLRDAIENISRRVHEVIISPPGGKNVTEWCKRQECWTRVCDIRIDLPALLCDELLSAGLEASARIGRSIESPDLVEQQLIAQAAEVPAETWYQLSIWAKETQNLHAWQRSLAFSLGRVQKSGKMPSRKQAAQGLLMLEEAFRLGFKPESVVDVVG
jgi:hypothetical protein